MNSDIVARLRLYANASIDGGWASVFRADLNIAADEIERLRAETDRLNRRLLAEENAYYILRTKNEHLQKDRNNLAMGTLPYDRERIGLE